MRMYLDETFWLSIPENDITYVLSEPSVARGFVVTLA